jgi:hypothetical protein
MADATVAIGPELSDAVGSLASLRGVSFEDLALSILAQAVYRELPDDVARLVQRRGAARFRAAFAA